MLDRTVSPSQPYNKTVSGSYIAQNNIVLPKSGKPTPFDSLSQQYVTKLQEKKTALPSPRPAPNRHSTRFPPKYVTRNCYSKRANRYLFTHSIETYESRSPINDRDLQTRRKYQETALSHPALPSAGSDLSAAIFALFCEIGRSPNRGWIAR